MRGRRTSWRALPSIAVALFLATAAWPADDERPAVEPTYEVRAALTETLSRLVRELFQERNDDGLAYRRGSFSHSFRAAPPDGWQVTFHRDTADRDRLRTERLLLTLQQQDGAWRVVDERVQGTFDGLVRGYVGDEEFHRFDRFSLDHEGLVITARNGSLYTDRFAGRLYRIVITAEQLEQRYAPPPHGTSFQAAAAWDYLTTKTPEKFEFAPEHVGLTCDPEECDRLLASAFTGLRPVAIEETDPALRRLYEEFRDEQERELRENGFRGFATPFEPGRRFLAVVVKKKGADDRLWLLHDSWAGWEVRFGATEYGTFLGYYSQQTLAGDVTPYDLEQRDDADARDYDLRAVAGTVELALADHSTMTGDVTFRLVTKRALRVLPFAIARLMRGGGIKSQFRDPSLVIDSIQDEQGRELTWVRVGSYGGVVVLPAEVPGGTRLTLRMQFTNEGAIYKLSPSYSRVARGGWLPFVRFSDTLEELDLTVKAPARYKTLGVGRKVHESTAGEVTTTRWVADGQVAFPTIIFGDYVVRQPAFRAERNDGTPIDVTIHVDRDGMTDWNIRPKQLPTLAEQAANALNLYREIFGVDYPYDKLDLVNDPMGFLYGQSPASIVYLGSAAFRGEGILVAAVGPWTMKSARSLVAHEVGHQWWGGIVTHANDRNYWFVESIAEYASALYLEAINEREDREKGWKAYLGEVERWREQVVHADLFGSVQHARSLNGGAYHAAIYAKGPYALHMLRMTFGREKFFTFLENLATELNGRPVVTRDIQRVAEETFGVPMDWFFDQWIRGTGLPEFELVYDTRATEDGNWLIEGKLIQRVVVGNPRHELTGVQFGGFVSVTAIGKKSKREYPTRLALEGAETPFMFKIPEKPGKLLLNKDGEMLSRKVEITRKRD